MQKTSKFLGYCRLIFSLGIFFMSANVLAQVPVVSEPVAKPPAQKTYLPELDSDEQLSSIFKDIVVIQRRAVTRSGKFLLGTSFQLDFSDGPKTQYGSSIKLGYGLSEWLEASLVYTPSFVANDRAILKSFQDLDLADGSKASLISPRAKTAYGLEINWIFAYGKDAWGPFSIVRSDTFLRLSGGSTSYDNSASGTDFGLGVGKTFFFSRFFNVRALAGIGSRQTLLGDKKYATFFGYFEPGLIWLF